MILDQCEGVFNCIGYVSEQKYILVDVIVDKDKHLSLLALDQDLAWPDIDLIPEEMANILLENWQDVP